ncbi:HAMP domain-containing sensor histidine kinase [Herbaspirillum lusitanum]|jgi:signal transduction histidine kinase|uniref:histidine kinase n=1 Tax=Herbaspirillum lusitanum TaxID=213312 RepID=A0ABW9A6N7_9BURK
MNPELAAIIVHDLKNSLGALEGELRALSEDSPRAHQAHVNCLALQEKLIGFLTLYKASSQGLQAQIEAVSPQDFLQALLRQQAFGKPGISIGIDTANMPLLGFFDEHLVALAVEAALQNATRFARSRIDLGCIAQNGGVVFTVRDDGPGIGTLEEKPSTGLGMDLCRAIALAHKKGEVGGSVTLSNLPEGGALFELYLP